MKAAFGLKSHSGWAALVVVGKLDDDLVVVDRRHLKLIEDDWAKQPYHAAKGLKPDAARDVVERGVEAAHRIAAREMRAAVERERLRENEVTACAVLVADPMPDWSTEEILAVHIRMHKAEGVLFRDALVHAAETCELRLVAIPERLLMEHAKNALGAPSSGLLKVLARLGKSQGPPWGKDQKDCALAALVALQASSK